MMKNFKKQFVCCLFAFLLFSTSMARAQNATLSIDVQNVNLEQFFGAIEAKTKYKFSYRNSILDKTMDITVKKENTKLEDILNAVLPQKGLEFRIASETSIVITKLAATSPNVSSKRIPISGNVTDQKGEEIIGATVMVEGQSLGTITDIDGNYSLEVPANATVIITYLGYIPVKFKESGKTTYNHVLKEDLKTLDEVVVVGYGTQKKVNLTGAVAMITADDLATRPIANLASGLQGLLSGVTVVNPTGQPGVNNTTVRIRGLGTIGNANPLILIDGIEGDMSTVNPDDIQSVSVLKDAASSAIYGARAANGVILITTKKLITNEQKPTIQFSSYYGIQTPTRLPKMANALEYMELENEAKQNVGTSIAWFPDAFEKVRTGSDPNYFGDTDWISAVLKSYAPQQNYGISLNDNIGQSGYMLSYRYFDQDGLTVGNSTGERRHNIRLKVNSYLLDRVTIVSNIGYVMRKITAPTGSLTSGGGSIYNAMRIQPNVPIYYTNGTWAYGGGNTNPVAVLHDGGNNFSDFDEFSLMETLKIDIVKGWDVSATYSIVNQNSLAETITKKIVFKNPEKAGTSEEIEYTYNNPNLVRNIDRRQRQQTLFVQSNFDFKIDKHEISGVAGFSQEWLVMRRFEASRTNLLTELNPTLNLGSKETMSNDASATQWAIRSGFGRLNYNFNNRYLLEFNVRRDLSSRFEKSHRAGTFPSFSAGWRISEESFMAFSRDIFDNIKWRGSWGKLGNQYVGSTDYPYMSVLTENSSGISLIGTNPTTSYTQTVLANPFLTWEKIDMLDFGFDLTLLNNRLNFTFDWYNKNTKGILLRLNYPHQIGASPSEENVGSVNNRGWEFNLNWRDKIGKLNYSLAFNLSDVKNKITDLGNTQPDLSGNTIRRVGDPINAFYGYIAEGLMMPEDFGFYDEYDKKYMNPKIPVIIGNDYQPGDIKYKDISGPNGEPDGRISPEYDKVVIGSAIPRYTYGFQGNLEYKGIDFSFMLQGVGKCNGFLEGTARHAFQDMAAYPQKIHLQRFNLETNPDPNASYPRLTHNTGFNQSNLSTFWLEDASYLRLKNIQLGYLLPKKWTQKVRVDKCRLYASGDNLLTFTKFFYAYDPETPVSSGGYYPQVKTLVVGFNLTFQ